MNRHVLLIIFLFSAPVWAFGPPSTEANNDGIKHYKAEEYPEAFSSFAEALSRDPFNPKYHLNLGDAFYKRGDLPKAMAEFESTSQSPKADNDTKFQALFNTGNAAVDAKDFAKALDYYQRALEIKPDSVETKTNIELALKEEQKQNKSGDKNDDKKQDKDQKDDQNKKNDENEKKKQEGDKEQQQKNQSPSQAPTPKPTPQGFKSGNLSESDVQRILEELKRQEQEIRARQYRENKNVPEREIEKDW